MLRPITMIGLLAALALLLGGCDAIGREQLATATPQPDAVLPQATPTPEIFIPLTAVASPAPTGESTLPLTCQVTDLTVYVNETDRYCFAYPPEFVMEASPAGQPLLYGQPLDDSLDPVRASLALDVSVAASDADLNTIVDSYLTQFSELDVPPITRQPTQIGGLPAEVVEIVPGREGSRDLFVLRDGTLFHFYFMPSVRDFPQAQVAVESLYQTVTGSFEFLP